MRFFDTNILVYAVTDQDPRKKRIANEVLSHALEVNHDGCISTQVLQEFCNTLLGKRLRTREEVDRLLDYYRELLVTDVTIDLVRHALEVKEEYGIQYYDALIVSTAEKLGCHEIVTEDLNPDQLYRGMAVVNPFAKKRSPGQGLS